MCLRQPEELLILSKVKASDGQHSPSFWDLWKYIAHMERNDVSPFLKRKKKMVDLSF